MTSSAAMSRSWAFAFATCLMCVCIRQVAGGCCIKPNGGGIDKCFENEADCRGASPPYNDKKTCKFSNGQNGEVDQCVGGDGPTVVGDPHLIGFNNERFDFMGIEGEYFNLFSHKFVQINMKLFKPAIGFDGTYIGAIAVTHVTSTGTDRILASLTDAGIKVEVNGKEQEMQFGTFTKLSSGAQMELVRVRPQEMAVGKLLLTLSTISLEIAAKVFVRDSVVDFWHHLDMAVEQVQAGLCGVHGLMGQTYRPQGYSSGGLENVDHKLYTVQTKKDVNLDYLVSGPFANDDSYSTFGKDVPCEVAAEAAARRLLKQFAGPLFFTAHAGVFSE